MNIAFVPIDNRPVCYDLVKDIISIDKSLNIFLPPIETLGDLKKKADFTEILKWLNSCKNCDTIILSLDTIAYGGLVASRRSSESFEEIKSRLDILKQILLDKKARVYAFSSIMRISNNNYNEEEKEYWSKYGKKIFEYSFSGGKNKSDIPENILEDYLKTRKRNFEINKLYLDWQKQGLFDTLIFSKDDCAEFGFNIDEAKELEQLGAKTKTGADEIPLSLLSRAIKKAIKVFIKYTEPKYKDLISNYEDVSIEQSVLGQLDLCEFKIADEEDNADIVLVVNNFVQKQGELVMDWDTGNYEINFTPPNKPYCIADVRYANGADNKLVEQVLPQIDLENFYGYAGWNTSANTIGSLLATIKVRYNAMQYDKEAFNKLQIIRFLDDWAYQANVRKLIDKPCNISNLMNTYEKKVLKTFNKNTKFYFNYIYPWNRKFEIRITF